jgi:hypothetical protein
MTQQTFTQGLTREQERQIRMRRINTTLTQAIEKKVDVDVNKLILELQMTYGIREETAKDYLNVVVKSMELNVINGVIYCSEMEKKEDIVNEGLTDEEKEILK